MLPLFLQCSILPWFFFCLTSFFGCERDGVACMRWARDKAFRVTHIQIWSRFFFFFPSRLLNMCRHFNVDFSITGRISNRMVSRGPRSLVRQEEEEQIRNNGSGATCRQPKRPQSGR